MCKEKTKKSKWLNGKQDQAGGIKEAGAGGFPGGAVVESLPASAGNTGSSPGLGGSHMPWSS